MFRNRHPIANSASAKRARISAINASLWAGLPRDLAQVVSEPIFDIPWFLEAAICQRLDPILRGRSPQRSDAGVPSSAELDIRRQTGVYETLSLSDRPFIKFGDSGCERLYEGVEFGIGQGAIYVAVCLCLFSPDVFRAEEHLEGAISADEMRQPSHRTAAGYHSHADFPLRDDGFFAAGETHVAGKRDLAAVAGRAAADERDGCDWQARQTDEEVRPGRQSCGAGRH